MPANPSWPRWTKATFARHLRAVAAEGQLALMIEGLDDRSKDFLAAQHRAEVTLTGYSSTEISKGYHRITFAVFVIARSVKQSNANAYGHQDAVGLIVAALDQCFEVKEYAPGNDAPDSVGTLTPDTGSEDPGIVARELKPGDGEQLTHSTIEARYTGYFQIGE